MPASGSLSRGPVGWLFVCFVAACSADAAEQDRGDEDAALEEARGQTDASVGADADEIPSQPFDGGEPDAQLADAAEESDGQLPVDAAFSEPDAASDASALDATAPDAQADASLQADASCDGACSCPLGHEPDGAGGCRNIDDCPGNQCQNGSHCVDGIGSYTCDCTGTQFRGVRCATAIPAACPAINTCTFEYPCVATGAGNYTCLGQYADWPMPNRAAQAPHPMSYDTSIAGVVVDIVTGLVWQKVVPSKYAGCAASTDCSLSEARSYCQNLYLDGKDDWRLPSYIELESLVDETKANIALDTAFLPLAAVGSYTTFATTSLYRPFGGYRGVQFLDGSSAGSSTTAAASRVRCVRGIANVGFTPDQRYISDASANTVTDRGTGLVWQRLVTTKVAWADAAQQCAAGFRLPTVKELLTLVDTTRYAPSFPSAFPDFTVGLNDTKSFWTSTVYPSAFSTTNTYVVRFADGVTQAGKQSDSYWVRCVK